MADETDKLVVNSDPTAALIMTTVRLLAGQLGAFFTHDGLVTHDQVQAGSAALATLAVLVWQLYASYRKSRTTLKVAQAHPADVKIK